MRFTDCINITGESCKKFDGNKAYISTGAVDIDHIDSNQIEIVNYDTKPSRANLITDDKSILFAKMQGTKKVLLIDQELKENVYSTGFFSVAPKENILNKKCLYHLLGSKTFLNQKDKYCSGATQKAITLEGLNKIEINIPKFEEQNQIAEKLDIVKQNLDYYYNTLNKYDDLVKARFVEMFGDPVSNSRALPKATLPELGEFGRGVSKHRPRNDPKLLGGAYPLIQTGDVAASDLYIKNYISTYSELGLLQSKMWCKGTLCITIAANIAKTAILDFDACFPDSVVGFIANEKTNNIYIHYWFSFFQDILEAQAPESAQKNINLKILSELKVICPPKKEQEQFSEFVKQVDKSKLAVQKSLEKTQQLFDSLMQEYFE